MHLSNTELGYSKNTLNKIISSIWTKKPTIKISEYAEQNRVLPPGTPFPGPWRNKITPYLVEPMDSMSAWSPVQREIIMKGAQLGFTAAAENVIAYWMGIVPSEILYITATQELLLKWATKRFEPVIDSYKLRKKIFAQHAAKQSKRTGDKTFSKEFFGGSIDMVSARSAPSLRSDAKRVLVRDEIDGAPRLLTTGEGEWLKVSFARTFAWGNRKKVLDYSTPGTYLESVIFPEYERGDQRRFFIPCPHCGEFQILDWGHGYGHDDNPNLGIQWKIQDGLVKDAWYVCPFCEKRFYENDKRDFSVKGEWRPTSKSYSEVVRSRQLSSLYSPIGMLSWKEMVEAFLEAEDRPDKMRSFVNLYLGLPYRETGTRPKWTNVIELRGNYRAGTVPNDVIFLTVAVDVQLGSEKEDRPNARLEMEVCGHGAGYRSWSIEYKVFEGPVDNENAGAWEKLAEYWRETKMQYKRSDGAIYTIKRGAVDSGVQTAAVYAFCAQWHGIFASKGRKTIKRKPDEFFDEDMNRSIKRFRVASLEGGQLLLEPNTVFYKRQIYQNLKIQRKPDRDKQQANFCDFPIEYNEDYFKQLTAEDMVIDRATNEVSFQKPRSRANEALDLRVLNLCCRDQLLDQYVTNFRVDAKAKGHNQNEIDRINSKTVLDWLARAIKAPKAK